MSPFIFLLQFFEYIWIDFFHMEVLETWEHVKRWKPCRPSLCLWYRVCRLACLPVDFGATLGMRGCELMAATCDGKWDVGPVMSQLNTSPKFMNTTTFLASFPATEVFIFVFSLPNLGGNFWSWPSFLNDLDNTMSSCSDFCRTMLPSAVVQDTVSTYSNQGLPPSNHWTVISSFQNRTKL